VHSSRPQSGSDMSDETNRGDMLFGGSVDEVRATIRLCGDDLDPAVVTNLLGVDPTFAARKGDVRPSGSSAVIQRTGVWCLSSKVARDTELEEIIASLLARLPDAGSTWDQLVHVAQIEVYCALFLEGPNRGVSLSSQLLRKLSDRHLELGIDIYAYKL